MKRLYLLRHAEALSTGTEDKARKLSERGKNQAQSLQKTTIEKDYKPEQILCSASLRTQQTLQGVCPDHAAEISDQLYNAPDKILMHNILTIAEDHKSLMVIAHNPGIHQLAFALAGSGTEKDMQSLAMSYQPCTLAVLDCPIERWNDLSLGENTLVDLIHPQI